MTSILEVMTVQFFNPFSLTDTASSSISLGKLVCFNCKSEVKSILGIMNYHKFDHNSAIHFRCLRTEYYDERKDLNLHRVHLTIDEIKDMLVKYGGDIKSAIKNWGGK